MLNFLRDIWNVLINIVNFVIHSIESIFVLLANIPRFLTYLTGIIAEIPAIYQSIMLVTLIISVVFLIVNRGK